MKRRLFFCLICVILAVASSASADLVTLSFNAITANNPSNGLIGEAQFFVDVIDSGFNAGLGLYQVTFTFRNTGPVVGVITEAYFDDGSLLARSTITNGPGVKFIDGATPANLPGGENIVPEFVATQAFSAEAGNPAPSKGVNPGEWVSILFDLDTDKTWQNVVDDISTGAIRVGVHATGIGETNPTSEGFVNNPVPEPATLAILGLGGLILRRRSA